ncbi:hypothetical protein C6345_10975 [Bacillus sp. LNXM12-2]|nr:hypothetical protein C6Y06_02260 [Bacillus sp. MZGC1]PRS79365.1 hypothetical protein C6Y04_02385 [Bacillus sp. GBSW2]PSB70264.1 hypothetical protein C6Y07_09785 [Bacillus sp. LNXM12-1]PSB73716.1 hypothetical protein C6345_10975 [Bacillus sp. LNXM12-2]
MSVLRAGAHEYQIRSAPVLVLPRIQRFSITLKRRQRAKIKTILALCQQTESAPLGTLSVYDNSSCFFNSVFTSFSWF